LQQTTAIKKEEELDQQEVDRKLIAVLPMVNQANLISEEMQKQMHFEVNAFCHVCYTLSDVRY